MSVTEAARSATVVVLVSALASAAGCSSGTEPDATARTQAPTVGDFCSALVDLRADFANADPSDLTGFVASVKSAAQRLTDVGTPTEMPAAARQGLEFTLERIATLPEGASADELDALNRADKKQRTQLRALEDYVEANCPMA